MDDDADEDDDGPLRSGNRTRIAAGVLAVAFLGAPALSVLFAFAGVNGSGRDWGPTLVGLGILAVIAILYLAIRRALQASVRSSSWNEDDWP